MLNLYLTNFNNVGFIFQLILHKVYELEHTP